MADRDEFLKRGYVHCPECWTRNLPTAVTCRKCGASMVVPAEAPDSLPPETRRKVNTSWMKGYAVAMWLLTVLIFVASVIAAVVQMFMPGRQSQALLWGVAGVALAVIHMLIGRGLWHERRWAKQAAFNLHGLVLGYSIIMVVYSFVNPGIAFLDYLLRPVILLGLIGVMALWVGVHAEEGERLSVYGPDPDSLPEFGQANTARVSFPGGISEAEWLRGRAALAPEEPVDYILPQRVNLPEPERDHWEQEQEDKKKSWDKLQLGALALAGMAVMSFFENLDDARDDEDDEDNSKKGRRRRRSKSRRGGKSSDTMMRTLGKILMGD